MKPITVIDQNGGETDYSYDANGNRTRISLPNGQITTYQYDSRNRLVRETVRVGTAVLADYEYGLDSTGHRTRITDHHNGRVTTYGYDKLHRLTGETVTDPVNGPYFASYQYDAVGNCRYSIIDGVHTA